MKKVTRLFCALGAAMVLFSCKNTDYQDAATITELKNELQSKFGKEAYYTNISVTNSKTGSVVGVSQTSDPASLKMSDWTKVQGFWKETAEVSLEVSEGVNPADFMFKLGEKVDLDLVGKLIDQSKEKVISEKKIKDVFVKYIGINAPNDGDFSRMSYSINIEPKGGGTTFTFLYNLDGSLRNFSY